MKQERSKPKQPVAAPQAAPFFLPTVAGLQPTFAPAAAPVEVDAGPKSRIISTTSDTALVASAKRAAAAGNCTL